MFAALLPLFESVSMLSSLSLMLEHSYQPFVALLPRDNFGLFWDTILLAGTHTVPLSRPVEIIVPDMVSGLKNLESSPTRSSFTKHKIDAFIPIRKAKQILF